VTRRPPFERRFVQVELLPGKFEPPVLMWGLTGYMNDFLLLWSSDMGVAGDEIGTSWAGLTECEASTIVDAETVDVPDEAWAALAKHRLLDA
jgi:hypothetical protein